MQSVRSILTARDDMAPADIDALFADFAAEAADCETPPDLEELIAEFFDLEPDYLFDLEIQQLLSRGVLR